MISTGFEQRVKIQQIIHNQIPEFFLDENPKFTDFLVQYYKSQEYPGGPVDIAENLDQYLNFETITPEVISGKTSLSNNITEESTEIEVPSTKGFPQEYGLLKIDDEIITYEKISGNKFLGCIRGFCGVTSYDDPFNPEELVFSTSVASAHLQNSVVINLSALFLQKFYKKLKNLFAPGFEDTQFTPELNVNNFISQIRSFYQSKGTEESIKILFKVLYNNDPKILNTENFLIKTSGSEYTKRKILICDLLTKGSNPDSLIGQEVRSKNGSFFGPVSNVEVVTRNNKLLYKIELFYGYDDVDTSFSAFNPTPKTKITEFVSAGSSIINVDSTVGFAKTGYFIAKSQKISYLDKNVNQFFGCSGITSSMTPGSDLYVDSDVIYGYENGDETKKIEFLVSGSISGVSNVDQYNFFNEGEQIFVGNFGDKVLNPKQDRSYKQTIFNSWLYNISSRYEIQIYANGSSTLVLYEETDNSSLKVGDYVDILKQNSEDIVLSNVRLINIIGNTLTIDTPISNVQPNQKLSIRRKYSYASSQSISLKYPKILSNIQNTYSEGEDYIYVASNSLPSTTIVKEIEDISKNINSGSDADFFFDENGKSKITFKYSILSFDTETPFITGDEVIYTHTTDSPIGGLSGNAIYYVEVLSEKNKIKLYSSRSFISSGENIELEKTSEIGSHKFTLSSQYGRLLSPTSSLVKIPLQKKSIEFEKEVETEPGPVGILANGVHIINYKSYDRIYYGPLTNISVINQGFDYDVVNPPKILISDPSSGVGTTALGNLVVEGSIKEVLVDPQKVSLDRVVSVSVSGGNGKGAILEPIVSDQFKEVEFKASQSTVGGGVDISNETITFLQPHGFVGGEKIIYSSNGNLPLGIGSFGQSNTDQNLYLVNGSAYYPQVLNSRAIKLYNTLTDLSSGINTVGFTTINTGGIHKFRLYDPIKVLSQIRVVDGGSGYANRVLRINPTGISTQNDIFNFKNHGFNDGDLVEYSSSGTIISGLSTTKNYYILKIDNDSFRIADAGDPSVGIYKSNYESRNYAKLESSGVGYQIFSYPPIKVNVDAQYSGSIGTITATPIVRGSIVDAYLYESGSDYGSQILNFHKKPTVSILKGSGAQLKPIIINGRLVSVEIQSRGTFYQGSVNLEVLGTGIGAKLRAKIVDGSIESVFVINGGVGYDENTKILVSSPGQGAILVPSVRYLTVNNNFKYQDEYLAPNDDDGLTYGIVGYSTDRDGSQFRDTTSLNRHSNIVGWSRDGYPIYGPYAFKDPENLSSEIIILKTGYSLIPSNIENRPSQSIFPAGFFVEDYKFDNSGDLDKNNGRYGKTPEFPGGTYAYFVGITTVNLSISGKLEPKFPYFIGNTYRSEPEVQFILDQNNDIDSTKLLRNTYPYRVSQQYSKNDFLPSVDFSTKQSSKIETVKSGIVENIDVILPGEGYVVGDQIVFDDTGTEGYGARAEVSEVYNKNDIISLQTEYKNYENVTFAWKNSNTIIGKILPYHNLENGANIQIIGLSTSIKNLSGNKKIKVESYSSRLTKSFDANVAVGVSTDIYIEKIPENVSVGSSIFIKNESFKLLNIFGDNIARVQRNRIGFSHTISEEVLFYPDSFEITQSTDYFESSLPEKVYFNPKLSVGVGTFFGSSSIINQYVGNYLKEVPVITQSIYLPNHNFKTNQKVILNIGSYGTPFTVSNTTDPSGGKTFNLPYTGTSEYVYIINKSKDYIGIVTQVGLTTQTSGLYFINNGSDYGDYSFESFLEANEKVYGTVNEIQTKVSISTNHTLKNNDSISLEVIPNLNVGGITTTESLKIKYNSDYNVLLVNPVGFGSTSVNVFSNTIRLPEHNLKTGQEIFYRSSDQTIQNVSTGKYYAVVVDKDNIKLSRTFIDSNKFPPVIVSIGSSGGRLQEISQVNPQILSVKNNDLTFNVSDRSLNGYNFEIFYDKQFNKKFVSVANTSQFTITRQGRIGIDTGAYFKINYTDQLPSHLYYTLTKDSVPIFTNQDENNYEISFIDSLYNGKYSISGIGNTYFYISLNSAPEKINYFKNECQSIKYTTNSKNAIGPIANVSILDGGFNYKKLPSISGIITTPENVNGREFGGKNALLKIQSNSIGKIGYLEIINDGYEYPSDKTLRPKCEIDSLATLSNSEQLIDVKVLDGGKNYLSKPNLVLVNTSTRKVVDSGSFDILLSASSISDIKIISRPNGLDSVTHQIFTVNNSNGIPIVGVTTFINGIVHCRLRTPGINGFSVPPFKPDDYVFIEGLSKKTFVDELGKEFSPGNGFNSTDHGYRFFRVTEFINDPSNCILKYDISPYTDYPGDPADTQEFFSSALNQKSYPSFELTQVPSVFFENELIYVNGALTDIKVKKILYNSITVSNSDRFKLKIGDSIKGSVSGNTAVVSNLFEYSGVFNISGTSDYEMGWKDDVGKLNNDLQVLPDNDYYQNLSYSIQSPIEFKEFIKPVNSLVHTSGTKNFADTGISSSAKTSIGSSQSLLSILDFISERRVDVVKDYDLVFDYDPTSNSSSYVRLLNKKLTDYIECRTNRVLKIDDISNSFSSSEFNKDVFLDAISYPITDFYSKFLIQVVDVAETDIQYQLSEVAVINDFSNTYTLNKSDLYTKNVLGSFNGEIGPFGDPVLRFNPSDPYGTSYKLKIYREYFDESTDRQTGFVNYGFARLYGKIEKLASSGLSTSIFRALSSQYDAIHTSAVIVNLDTNKLNYFEVSGCYDGVNTHLSEFYFDTEKTVGGYSSGIIGTFGLTVSSGILDLNFTSNQNNNILIKAKTVGFGTTAVGVGTYRFLVPDQIPETERSSRLESDYKVISGISTIKILNSSIESAIKSIVKVSVGSTIAMHQVMLISDQTTVNIQSDPFITVGTSNGIGTFSTSLNGSFICINFHPDSKFSSSKILVQSYDQVLYAEYDEFNDPDILTYGPVYERQYITRYGSINNYGKDRLDFDLNYNRIPIFQKSFNPKNENILNKESGIFTIKDHFFETGEELIYTPGSSLSGISPASVGIGSTIVGGTTVVADIIVGFNTITGLASTTGISTGETLIIGKGVPENTKIVSIGSTYSYFYGNVVSGGSSVITGIGNTVLLKVGSGIFSGNNRQSLGTIVKVGIDSITVSNTISSGNDRLYYSSDLNYSLTLSKVSTATTFRTNYYTGIITNICPSTVYAIKIDKDSFRLTGVSGGSGVGFTFTSSGSGNLHKLEMKKKLEKTVITINGVNQYPLSYTPLTFSLSQNLNGSVGVGTTFIRLSGISSILSGDIIKLNNEYMTIQNVGFGTTVIGPITGIGTIPLIEVNRGALGSVEQAHNDGVVGRIYKGSYNIVGNKIWFSDAPDGKGNNEVFSENFLPTPKSTFSGRVFLRKDYTTNQIYDDISQNFNGIGRTFTLFKEESVISSAVPGNNLVFINDVFQTPDTENNSGNNYQIINSPGISSISFTGVKIPNTDDVFTVDYDVNQNQLPRGGLLVSVAFTGGLGYAPLVGIPSSMIDIKVGAGGSISSIGFTTSIVVGIATTGNIGIATDIITGISTRSIKVNQRVIDILNTQTVNLVSAIVPDLTKILRQGTRVSSIGISSIFLSKTTTNSVAITTTFGFDVGPSFGSGYYKTVSIGVTDVNHSGAGAIIDAFVGSGGTVTSFRIINGGTGYSTPIVSIPDPTYEKLPIIGISRVSTGNTTECGIGVSMTLSIMPSDDVGIGSGYWKIRDFELVKSGYGFELGDVFTPVGLTTAYGLANPIEPIRFTVYRVEGDSFASWQVGEFDYIDSIKSLQNGIRTRFPLYKNNKLLSFEINRTDPISSLIDFDSVILIYVNGVMQVPGVSYNFTGGTSFVFKEPPKPEDNVSIFFYRGTAGIDSIEITTSEKLKPGDDIIIKKNDAIKETVDQDKRTVSFIQSSDIFETGIYLGDGIDEVNPKPMDLIYQKRDLIINDEYKFKDRDSLETLIFPTSKIIKSFTNVDNEIFVDNANFFNYEEDYFEEDIRSFDALILLNDDKVSAAITSIVSAAGTISNIRITDGGSGYTGIGNSILLKIRKPIGSGSTSPIIYASVSAAGTITSPFNIVNPGYGYSIQNPPEIIAPIPSISKENISPIRFVDGFSGIITGITTSAGIGTDLALKFFVKYGQFDNPSTLKVGYPIYVFDTSVGSGVTSIDTNDTQKVAIGTYKCDNIYYIHSINNLNLNGEIVCNILSKTNFSGINTFGTSIKGRFSWGRFSGMNRSESENSLSVNLDSYTTNSGLTSYPSIQRRGYGLRSSGALVKIVQ